MLSISGLTSGHGRVRALHDVAIEVEAGEIVALLGANGAGKTTLLRTISGVHPAWGGSIRFDGREQGKLRAPQRLAAGLVQVPEGRQLFSPMTVEENLRLGAYRRQPKAGAEAVMAEVYALFPVLAERRTQAAGDLSGGEQQMLALGRAMMAEPRLLLLDEPSMGLAPIIVERIFAVIRELHRRGVTILLVEQNAYAALGIADRAYVLETGRVTLSGTGAGLLADQRVREAYLGA